LRVQHVTNVLAKQLSIIEVSSKIATVADESLSKQQRALFLRQQLAAISAELQHLSPGNTDLHGTGND
jgi:ATP-dependent Lon protease